MAPPVTGVLLASVPLVNDGARPMALPLASTASATIRPPTLRRHGHVVVVIDDEIPERQLRVQRSGEGVEDAVVPADDRPGTEDGPLRTATLDADVGTADRVPVQHERRSRLERDTGRAVDEIGLQDPRLPLIHDLAARGDVHGIRRDDEAHDGESEALHETLLQAVEYRPRARPVRSGEGGIRTLGTLWVHTLSRRAPSAARAPLRATNRRKCRAGVQAGCATRADCGSPGRRR